MAVALEKRFEDGVIDKWGQVMTHIPEDHKALVAWCLESEAVASGGQGSDSFAGAFAIIRSVVLQWASRSPLHRLAEALDDASTSSIDDYVNDLTISAGDNLVLMLSATGPDRAQLEALASRICLYIRNYYKWAEAK